jgi:hypothetical protein
MKRTNEATQRNQQIPFQTSTVYILSDHKTRLQLMHQCPLLNQILTSVALDEAAEMSPKSMTGR